MLPRAKNSPYLNIGSREIVECRASHSVGLGLTSLDLAVNGLDKPSTTVNDRTGSYCCEDRCHGFISYNIVRAKSKKHAKIFGMSELT